LIVNRFAGANAASANGRRAVIRAFSPSGTSVLPNFHFCQNSANAMPFPDGNLCARSGIAMITCGAAVPTFSGRREPLPNEKEE
jgi:hypothetical protein